MICGSSAWREVDAKVVRRLPAKGLSVRAACHQIQMMTRTLIRAVPPKVALLRRKAQRLQEVLILAPQADQHAHELRHSFVFDVILGTSLIRP